MLLVVIDDDMTKFYFMFLNSRINLLTVPTPYFSIDIFYEVLGILAYTQNH